MGKSLLHAERLSFRFPGAQRTTLAPLSTDWRAGELCALVGPNGSGKTTLLNLLSGALRPSAGSVRFADRPLNAWPPLELAQRRAVLPQSPRLEFSFSVGEVVALGRSPYGDSPERRQDVKRITEALDEVGLAPYRDRPFPRLSRGEKQRVQLARVLAQLPPPDREAPAALFLDEPINHLDLEHQHGTLAIARRRADEGTLVIAVLHDLNLALRYADRVLVLSTGELSGDGTPEEVLTPERLKAVFQVEAERLTDASGGPFLAFRGIPPSP